MNVTGKVTFAGVTGGLAYGVGAVLATNQNITESEIGDGVEKEEHLDGNGEYIGARWAKRTRTINLTFTPVSASTSANARSACQLPAIPTKVTLTDFNLPAGGSALIGNGNLTSINTVAGILEWYYEGGGSIQLSDKIARVRMPLVAYLDSPDKTNLATVT